MAAGCIGFMWSGLRLWILICGFILAAHCFRPRPPHREALACKRVPAVGGGINARFFSAPSVVVNLGFGASGEVLNLSAFPAPTCIRKMPRAILRASKNISSLTPSLLQTPCHGHEPISKGFDELLVIYLLQFNFGKGRGLQTISVASGKNAKLGPPGKAASRVSRGPHPNAQLG